MSVKKSTCYRVTDKTNERIVKLSKILGVNKGDIVDNAVSSYYSTIEKESEMNTSIDEMKYKLDEMMNEIKVIRMYHILDTLKRSDYSNIKDVPSLTLKFDEDGRYGNKGDYVVKIEDVDKLTDYLSKTTNYYDKALSEVAKKTTQADKK
ncbi:hypothetical protein [Catenibacterium sp.]|uniref:hypothetical protein n=1 Tax=Catenibacterium sp. TaxID=2049022 RepID=UPI003FD76FD2